MSERYKKEIEDILNQAGDIAPGPRSKPGLPRMLWAQAVRSVSGKPWSISPGRVMIAAIALLVAGVLLRPAIPGATGAMLWAALLLFILGYALFFVRPSKMGASKPGEKRWRGQPIEYDQNSWWDKLRRRVK